MVIKPAPPLVPGPVERQGTPATPLEARPLNHGLPPLVLAPRSLGVPHRPLCMLTGRLAFLILQFPILSPTGDPIEGGVLDSDKMPGSHKRASEMLFISPPPRAG